jgi:hypothetical protein
MGDLVRLRSPKFIDKLISAGYLQERQRRNVHAIEAAVTRLREDSDEFMRSMRGENNADRT